MNHIRRLEPAGFALFADESVAIFFTITEEAAVTTFLLVLTAGAEAILIARVELVVGS